MSRFATLLEPDFRLPVGVQQQLAAKRLPELVSKSGLHWWRPGDPIPSRGPRLLLGVAPYSMHDLQLLDQINEYLQHLHDRPPHIDVFSTLECKIDKDFELYVPAIGRVLQTPVAGMWMDGLLQYRAQGAAARRLLAELLGIKSS